jgi:hypothetical protein
VPRSCGGRLKRSALAAPRLTPQSPPCRSALASLPSTTPEPGQAPTLVMICTATARLLLPGEPAAPPPFSSLFRRSRAHFQSGLCVIRGLQSAADLTESTESFVFYRFPPGLISSVAAATYQPLLCARPLLFDFVRELRVRAAGGGRCDWISQVR